MDTRKAIRLPDYSYSDNGAYFITICTKDRQPCLGEIVGDGFPDVPCNERIVCVDNVNVKLTYIGEIVKQSIEFINEHNKDIDVKKYVVMPNHIHLLVMVNVADGTYRSPSPTQNNSNIRANELIPKLVSSLKRYTNKKCGFDIWQRSFYDHVIRNQKDYDKIWEYIDTNPLRWELDKYFI